MGSSDPVVLHKFHQSWFGVRLHGAWVVGHVLTEELHWSHLRIIGYCERSLRRVPSFFAACKMDCLFLSFQAEAMIEGDVHELCVYFCNFGIITRCLPVWHCYSAWAAWCFFWCFAKYPHIVGCRDGAVAAAVLHWCSVFRGWSLKRFDECRCFHVVWYISIDSRKLISNVPLIIATQRTSAAISFGVRISLTISPRLDQVVLWRKTVFTITQLKVRKTNTKQFKSERIIPYSISAAEMFQLQYEVRLQRINGAVQISELRARGPNNHRLAFGSYSTNF